MPRGTIATEAIPVLPAAGAPLGPGDGDGGAGDGAAEAVAAGAGLSGWLSGGGGPDERATRAMSAGE
jgi:hypothetical protein